MSQHCIGVFITPCGHTVVSIYSQNNTEPLCRKYLMKNNYHFLLKNIKNVLIIGLCVKAFQLLTETYEVRNFVI